MSDAVEESKPSTSEIPVRRQIHPVIEIVNGYKHYGMSKKWHQVIRNFNLTAYSGEIYVLLGPHGAGKTTVINVVLGITKLNEGFVKVFGFTPGEDLSGIPGVRVGFAPQSHGLYPEFTINEIFRYYGKLLALETNYINRRICYLTDFLYLPDGKQFIKNCTEAEKRQVSFAAAILHEPELLILDEPCHGVDPVLRNSIWELLKSLVNEHEVTVFVTTQNLPEANQAHKVGIVRSGYLLMEGNIPDLLSTYHAESLETLYMSIYALSIRKNLLTEKKSIEENPLIVIEKLVSTGSEGFMYTGEFDQMNEPPPKAKRKITDFDATRKLRKILPSFKRLGIIMLRDITRIYRNYVWAFLLLIFPILVIILVSYTIGMTPTNLHVAVVNFEATESECAQGLDEFLSCHILSLISKDVVTLVHFEKYEDAEQQAFRLKVSAILIIGEKFTSQLTRIMADVAFDNNDFHNPDTSQLILRLDMTSRIIANTIENAIKTAVEGYLKIATKGTNIEQASVGYLMKVGVPIYGQANSSDTEFITTGLSISLLYHLAAYVSSLALVSDRTMKMAARDYMAGVRPIETIISQIVILGLVICLGSTIMFAGLMLIRQIPIKGSLPCLLLVVIVQISCGLCFGFVLANICKTTVQSSYAVYCFLTGTLILCGVVWPLDGQPKWLLILVELLPQTRAICAVRCIVQRGLSVDTQEVYLGVLIPFIWLILFILLAILINKITY